MSSSDPVLRTLKARRDAMDKLIKEVRTRLEVFVSKRDALDEAIEVLEGNSFDALQTAAILLQPPDNDADLSGTIPGGTHHDVFRANVDMTSE